MNWEKEFNEIYRKATGEENIVGDLLVKQFIQNLLDKQKEEILKDLKNAWEISGTHPIFHREAKDKLKLYWETLYYAIKKTLNK